MSENEVEAEVWMAGIGSLRGRRVRVGDRVRFVGCTEPVGSDHELGTVEAIEPTGQVHVLHVRRPDGHTLAVPEVPE